MSNSRQIAPRGNLNTAYTLNVIPRWSIWAGTVMLPIATVALILLLLHIYGGGSPQDKTQLEIIKLAGSIALGAGGAVGLFLAARRQRSTELGLVQIESDLAYKEQMATDARSDAAERRATELYAAAAEQLGSDKAPVRMAGLYALERFGQANVEYRTTVVNLLCAYLRMPFKHPHYKPDPSTSGLIHRNGEHSSQGRPDREPLYIDLAPTLALAAGLSLDDDDQRRQELEVRRTARRILNRHMRPDPNEDGVPTNEDFWQGMILDLTGAVLDGFDMRNCHAHEACFEGTQFYGRAQFDSSHFTGLTTFKGAKFHYNASFYFAHFHGAAIFNETRFEGLAEFNLAHFHKDVTFADVDFGDKAAFRGAHFHQSTWFERLHFHGTVDFKSTRFEPAKKLFVNCRYRQDIDRSQDKWPTGWKTSQTAPLDEGQSDGMEGVWDIVKTDEPSEN